MKRLIFFFLMLQLSIPGYVFALDSKEDLDFSSKEFIDHWGTVSPKFQKLKKKIEKDFQRFEKSEEFLRRLFYRSQLHLLYDYNQYASINELIETGKFDCVSGSLLMASFLDYYQFDYEIIETSYHVFIKVRIANQLIVLESTDENGYLTHEEEVTAYLKNVEKDSKQSNLYLDPKDIPIKSLIQPSIYRAINIRQLKGLEYFNRAIFLNNQAAYNLAYEKAKAAEILYPSERIVVLRRLLEQQLVLAQN